MKAVQIQTVEEAQSIKGAVAALFEEVFHRPFSADAWERYYYNNPYGAPLITVLYDDGNIIGHQALIPQVMCDRAGQPHPYLQSISTMVHPQHRGLPVFHQLVSSSMDQAHLSGAEYILGFPNDNSYLLFTRLFRWHLLLDTPLFDVSISHTTDEHHINCSPLPEFTVCKDGGHPYASTYQRWRCPGNTYTAVMINGRLAIIYKVTDDGAMNVIEAHTSNFTTARTDIESLANTIGVKSIRLAGKHAEELGFPSTVLTPHDNYHIRMCCYPLIAEPPVFNFSLLLSDVF